MNVSARGSPAEVPQKSRRSRAGVARGACKGPLLPDEGRLLPDKGRDTVFPGVPARRSPAEVPPGSRGGRAVRGPGPQPGSCRSRAGVPPGSCKGSLLSDGGSLLSDEGRKTVFPVVSACRSPAELVPKSRRSRAEIARGSRRDISTVFARFRGLFLTGFLTGKSVARSWT